MKAGRGRSGAGVVENAVTEAPGGDAATAGIYTNEEEQLQLTGVQREISEVTELLPPAEGGVNGNVGGNIQASSPEDLNPERRLAVSDHTVAADWWSFVTALVEDLCV